MTARAIPIPRLVPTGLHPLAREYLQAGDFEGVLYLVNSQERLSCLRALWGRVPPPNRPALLAGAIGSGDAPSLEYRFLLRALRSLSGVPVTDGEQARAAFDALPDAVTVYRGTVEREVESRGWGVCWTLDPERAQWFATKHGRFRVRDSAPVIVTAERIPRACLSGLLMSRNEREVLALPEVIAVFRECVSHRIAEGVAA